MQRINGFLNGAVPKKNKKQVVKWLLNVLFVVIVLGSIERQIHCLVDLFEEAEVCRQMQKEIAVRDVHTLMSEMQYFPVQKDTSGKVSFFYENGYGGERTYGGRRKHEGIDIMASKDQVGCLSVQSVSDGVVEQMGWLPLGGYRLGIRSSSGFYYYYAHLESYAVGITQGKKVAAGEILGLMGNTGYGKEGTRGKFAVHLHFGIYHQVEGKEKSLNPYYLLEHCSQKD